MMNEDTLKLVEDLRLQFPQHYHTGNFGTPTLSIKNRKKSKSKTTSSLRKTPNDVEVLLVDKWVEANSVKATPESDLFYRIPGVVIGNCPSSQWRYKTS